MNCAFLSFTISTVKRQDDAWVPKRLCQAQGKQAAFISEADFNAQSRANELYNLHQDELVYNKNECLCLIYFNSILF